MTAGTERAWIAQVGPDPEGPGGMEAVLADLLRSPLAEDYQLDLIVTYRTPRPLRRLLVFARSLLTLARWCHGPGQRVVHVHTAIRGSVYRKALCVMVAKQARRPVVLQLHAGAGDIEAFAARLGPARRRLLRRGFQSADVVVSVSSAGADRIERDFGVGDVALVPNAAPEVGTPPPIDGQPPRLLFMGGFDNPSKGGDILLAALAQVLEDRPDLEVVLAGTGSLPPDAAALQRRYPGVSWTGWLDPQAKADRLSHCTVFVMPSISEGMPIALLEAMAYGRAIVASAVGGIPDVVTGDVEALLVPPARPDALAAAIIRLVRTDDLRRSLGAAARKRVEEFAPDAIYPRYAALYEDLLARSGQAIR
jgi:glycosyltransferase involved in cell wall biosynthesis